MIQLNNLKGLTMQLTYHQVLKNQEYNEIPWLFKLQTDLHDAVLEKNSLQLQVSLLYNNAQNITDILASPIATQKYLANYLDFTLNRQVLIFLQIIAQGQQT